MPVLKLRLQSSIIIALLAVQVSAFAQVSESAAPSLPRGDNALVLQADHQPVATYHMEYYPARRVQVDDRITLFYPQMQVGVWRVFWRTLPSLPFMRVREDRASYSIDGGQEMPMKALRELGPDARPVWAVWAASSGSSSIAVRNLSTVDLYEARLVPGSPLKPVPPLSSDEQELYTRPTPTYDFESTTLKAWIERNDLKMHAGESDLQFAYRVAMYTCRSVRYDASPTNAWIASNVCERMFGECCQQSILAAAVLRAAKIPARTVCCRWVADSGPIKDAGGHVWNIFYARGIGWVPFDVTIGQPNDRGAKWFGYYNPLLLPRMVDFDFVLPTDDKGGKATVSGIDAFVASFPTGQGKADGAKTEWSGQIVVH